MYSNWKVKIQKLNREYMNFELNLPLWQFTLQSDIFLSMPTQRHAVYEEYKNANKKIHSLRSARSEINSKSCLSKFQVIIRINSCESFWVVVISKFLSLSTISQVNAFSRWKKKYTRIFFAKNLTGFEIIDRVNFLLKSNNRKWNIINYSKELGVSQEFRNRKKTCNSIIISIENKKSNK